MDEQKGLNDVLHGNTETRKALDDVLHDIGETMGKEPWQQIVTDMQQRPMYYNRDGSPIVGDSSDPMGTLIWARMFEDHQSRIVGRDRTLYGEKLSTVWLGLDHNYFPGGRPLIFETMLFAPESDELRKTKRDRMRKIAEVGLRKSLDKLDIEWQEIPEEKYIEKHYPHDNLQERYSTEQQAKDGHAKLKLQCLIPPRWRRFILYKLGGDELWA